MNPFPNLCICTEHLMLGVGHKASIIISSFLSSVCVFMCLHMRRSACSHVHEHVYGDRRSMFSISMLYFDIGSLPEHWAHWFWPVWPTDLLWAVLVSASLTGITHGCQQLPTLPGVWTSNSCPPAHWEFGHSLNHLHRLHHYFKNS